MNFLGRACIARQASIKTCTHRVHGMQAFGLARVRQRATVHTYHSPCNCYGKMSIFQHATHCMFSLPLRSRITTSSWRDTPVKSHSCAIPVSRSYGDNCNARLQLCKSATSRKGRLARKRRTRCCAYTVLRGQTVQRASTGEVVPVSSLWQVRHRGNCWPYMHHAKHMPAFTCACRPMPPTSPSCSS